MIVYSKNNSGNWMCKINKIFTLSTEKEFLVSFTLKTLNNRKIVLYTYTFHVNPLTHVGALSSITFYSTPYYSLCNAYCYSLYFIYY